MAINRFKKVALSVLSQPDLNVKKHYKIERSIVNLVNHNFFRRGYIAWDHKIVRDDYEIPVRLFLPGKKARQRILLYFHGGGWVFGNIDSYDRTCANLAKATDHMVISVDYRLAPEFRFPAAAEDCYCAAKELFGFCRLLDVEPDQITLIGDSAGGNLAAVVSQMARDRGEFSPARQILIYPAAYNDHTLASPYPSVHLNGADCVLTSKRINDYMDLYRSSEADLINPYFAPLLAKDFSRQPKTLVITAELDPLRDEGEDYGQKLRRAGNTVAVYRVKDALHGFFTRSPGHQHVKEAIAVMNRFLNEGEEA